MAVWYEWDLEYVDGDGNVEDHDFYDSAVEVVQAYRTAQLQSPVNIVLVRDTERGDRSWAYVKDGVLPEWFSADNREVYKVPQRFHKEWRRANVSS